MNKFLLVHETTPGKLLKFCRTKMELTIPQLAELLGVSDVTWKRKEANDQSKHKKLCTCCEQNLVMLLADEHPFYELEQLTANPYSLKHKHTGSELLELRKSLGLTRPELASELGMHLSRLGYREKSTEPDPASISEYNILLLLANKHPYYNLKIK